MKKVTIVSIVVVIFGLVAVTFAMSAALQTENPVDPATPVGRSTQYLPSSLEGYVRVVPPYGYPYVVHESEIPELHQTDASNKCDQILPTRFDDYYRVLSLDRHIVVIHKEDLEAYCGTGGTTHEAVSMIFDRVACNQIIAIVPTLNEDYYRILDENGSLYLVHKDEITQACGMSLNSEEDLS